MATTSGVDDYLFEVLEEADLEHFAQPLAEKLQVTKLEHFSHVKDSDLSGIGLSQPAIKRLKAFIKDKKNILKRQQKSTSKVKGGKLSPVLSFRNKSSGDIEETSNVTCLISKDDVKVLETLGEGSFGVVKRATWKRSNGKKVDVAVKLLFSSAAVDAKNDFTDDTLKEINAMHALRHPNLIRLYGLVLSPPIMMVTELCEGGAVLDRLRSTSLPVLLIDQLIDYGIQIAKGMAYLELKSFIHRDLAARNILLSADEKIAKIGDFGLMRALPNREEHYVMSGQKKVPFAWCPPESLKFRKFSCASDVWAFGVTLWEMFSFGEEPWCGLNGAEILQKVTAGDRLPEPDACPTSVFQLLMQCWSLDPGQRPTFPALKELLNESVLTIGKCKEAQVGEGLLELNIGDRIMVISGNADCFYWYGQNMRTRKLGKFARKHIFLEESTGRRRSDSESEPGGSSVFFEIGGGGLTSNMISRPIRGSFVHTGHGDAIGGTSWGAPDKIDPIFLNNPLWIPPSAKKNTNSDIDRRKAASISCTADDRRALVFNDELVARNTNLSDEERIQATIAEVEGRPKSEALPRRNESYHLANSTGVSKARNISSSTTTSGGESSSFGSSNGFATDFDNPSNIATNVASGITSTSPSSRPYYCVPPPAAPPPQLAPPPPSEERRAWMPTSQPPAVTIAPPSPHVPRLYDDVPTTEDPFEVPVQVKTLSNRQRYSEMYAPPPSVPSLPPPPISDAQYSRIAKKTTQRNQQQQNFQFASTMPASITEVKPPSMPKIPVVRPILPPTSPLKSNNMTNNSRPTAITKPFIQQSNSVGPPPTVSQTTTTNVTNQSLFLQQKNNLLMDELARKFQHSTTNFVYSTNEASAAFSSNGTTTTNYGLPLPNNSSGFEWTGTTTMNGGHRTQSVPDVSAATSLAPSTSRKMTNADTHQILDLFDPLTNRPPGDFIALVRAQAPFASDDRCAVMLKRCQMNVQNAIKELKTEKLVDMGLAVDRAQCVRALENSEWDVNAAAEKLLG